MSKISVIEPKIPTIPKRCRVAAYARVSLESENLLHSLSAQISYYSEMIQKNPEWEYAGVYADRFVSGTGTAHRPEFQRLIADCDAGLVDMVLCKSISRFARNTVDLLETVRHLKELGIEVRFEKEGINTLSSEGEMLLTLLASFAEQESASLSGNLKWAIQKKFERGEPWGQAPYGYTAVGNDYIVNEDEAVFIRKIFEEFLADIPMGTIARELKESDCKCTTLQFVRSVLTNVVYVGDLLLQQHYSPTVRCMKKNNGELPKYYVQGHHPAIISHETFDRVQRKIKAQKNYNKEANRLGRVSCFSSKITCAVCGHHYVSYGKNSWACFGKLKSRKRICQNGNLIISRLEKLCADVLEIENFDGDMLVKMVHNMLVNPDGRITFTFYDGRIIESNILFFKSEQRKYQDPHTQFYGYTWNGSEYVINEEEAAVIRMIYDDYLNAMTISDISRKLVALGYNRRGSFSRKAILNYLSNIFYTGTRIYPAAYSGTGKDETLENDHAAIIDKETFNKAAERRKIHADRYKNSRNHQSVHIAAD